VIETSAEQSKPTRQRIHQAARHESLESLAGPPRLETNAGHFQATANVRYPGGRIRCWHIREDSRNWRDEEK
jgi:hypothetical protein